MHGRKRHDGLSSRELPDNLPACHAVIRRQAEVIAELQARVEEQGADRGTWHAIERLKRDLAAVKRQLFGSRRERFVAGRKKADGRRDAVLPQQGTGTSRPRTNRPSQRRIRVTPYVPRPATADHRSLDSAGKSPASPGPAEGSAGIVE